jgi:hypothetical protein
MYKLMALCSCSGLSSATRGLVAKAGDSGRRELDMTTRRTAEAWAQQGLGDGDAQRWRGL